MGSGRSIGGDEGPERRERDVTAAPRILVPSVSAIQLVRSLQLLQANRPDLDVVG